MEQWNNVYGPQSTQATVSFYRGGTLIATTTQTVQNDGYTKAFFGVTSPGAPFDRVIISDPQMYLHFINDIQYRVAPDSLVIVGPAVATRGDTVTFIARRTTPGSPNVVPTKWEFRSTDARAPGYTYTRTDGVVSDSTWKGPILMSGVVHVEAQMGGKTVSRDTTITVNPRAPGKWRDTLRYTLQFSPPPNVFKANPPTTVHDLGGFRAIYRGFDLTQIDNVNIGPNAGVSYFTGLPYPYDIYVWYNDLALNSSSAFYNAQPNTGSGNTCGKPDVLGAIPLVKAHGLDPI